MIQELINRQIATAHFNRDLSSVDFHADTTTTKLVNACGLTHEHNLQLLLVGVVVYVLGQLGIDDIIFDRNIDSDSFLDVHNLLLLVCNVLLLHLGKLF